MKVFAIILSITLLIGCQAEPRVYDSGIAKHPYVLTLKQDGSYHLAHLFMPDPMTKGRWVTMMKDAEVEVVLFDPDQPGKATQYARLVDPGKNLISLSIYDNMKDVWLYGHFPASGSDGYVPPTYPYKR